MSNYEAPPELRGLEKGLQKLCANGERDISRVFEDWLRYIVANFMLDPEPDKTWPYTKDENRLFYDLMAEWFMVMKKQLNTKTWYDAFGELYMSLIVSKSTAQSNGQFFTPPHICDLMRAITGPTEKVTKQIVSDPTCGSGRLLLSFHVENLGNYLVAEDLSFVCCLMTVCNFLIHGCCGEVIWHNSLDPQSWNGGWRTFGATYGLPLPHVEKIEKNQSSVMQHWEDRRQKPVQNVPIIMAPNPIQLQLF